MQDQFFLVEQEYFRLRGQFAVGRITEEEFDSALRQLAFEDDEGHFWMIGANSARWYYSVGLDWYESDPVQVVGPRDELDVPPGEYAQNTGRKVEVAGVARGIADETEGRSSPARTAVPFLLIALVLLGVAALAFYLFSNVSNLFASVTTAPMPTRIAAIVPASEPNQPANVAAPTAAPTRTNTPQPGASPIPVTETPGLVLAPTDTRPALDVIPTITPSAPNSGDEDLEFVSENGVPAYNGPLAPDVYVTGMRISPNPPPQRAPVTFTASFLNTNRETIGMEWRVVFLDPNKGGRNKDWGQSQTEGINVPPGRSEFSLVFTPVTGRGPCVTLQVLAARRLENDARHFLPNTTGSSLVTNSTFC